MVAATPAPPGVGRVRAGLTPSVLDVTVELAAAPAYRSEAASAALRVPVLVAG